MIYHVLNRANARMTIFEKDGDYEAFEQIVEEAVQRYDMRLLAYQVITRLDAARERASNGRRIGSRSSLHRAWPTFRFRHLDREHHRPPRPRKHPTPPRQTPEARKRFLTPFFV